MAGIVHIRFVWQREGVRMSDSQSDTSRPSPEQPSSLSGNRGDRRGPLNRALIREKKSRRNESSAERDFKDTDGEYINRQRK